jgi:hypothetical protein
VTPTARRHRCGTATARQPRHDTTTEDLGSEAEGDGEEDGRERRVKAVERVGMPWELARGAFVVGKKGGGGGVEEDGVLDGEKEEEGG